LKTQRSDPQKAVTGEECGPPPQKKKSPQEDLPANRKKTWKFKKKLDSKGKKTEG